MVASRRSDHYHSRGVMVKTKRMPARVSQTEQSNEGAARGNRKTHVDHTAENQPKYTHRSASRLS